MIAAAVPVKDVVNAKQRLMAVLDGSERRELARAMLVDVLRALAAARLDRVWVVTREAEVAAIAQRFGAEALEEAENLGHTAAVATAQAEAVRVGALAFLTIPGDVPCVTAAEIRALVAAGIGAGAPGVAFAPSRSGLGTNGALLSPPAVMRLRFGEPSFDNHLVTARALGLDPRVVRLRGLGLDVDAPDDLVRLLTDGAGTESRALLEHWRLPQRLAGVRPAVHG
jgi:2-phospho-L-lactate/phosphoenolpyruvate guanylyltransferase